MPTCSNRRQLCRQWFGVICLFIELNLAGGTVFGLPALFPVLPQYGIYDNACTVTLNSTGQSEKNCDGQTRHYQVMQQIMFVYAKQNLHVLQFLECIDCRNRVLRFSVDTDRYSHR
jgi:hypothetical protein